MLSAAVVLPLNAAKRPVPRKDLAHVETPKVRDLKVRLTLRVAAIVGALLHRDRRLLPGRCRSRRAGADRDHRRDHGEDRWSCRRPSCRGSTIHAPRFPDLDSVATSVMTPGLCLAFRAENGDMVQRICGGQASQAGTPPQTFAAFYRALFVPGREAIRPVAFRGTKLGDALAWVDPAVQTAEAWHEAGRLMTLARDRVAAALCAGLCGAGPRAAPTRLRSGIALERIATGDLTTRLPPFDLAELSAIRDGFNHPRREPRTALNQRSELTRKLISAPGRRAPPSGAWLHDEFGQSLAAIRALAASARQTAMQ